MKKAAETVISLIGNFEYFCKSYPQGTHAAERHLVIYVRSDSGTDYANSKLRDRLKKQNMIH